MIGLQRTEADQRDDQDSDEFGAVHDVTVGGSSIHL